MIAKALVEELERRYGEVDWSGVRSFLIEFNDDAKRQPVEVWCRQPPAIKKSLEYDEHGDLKPSFWSTQTPLFALVRSDEVMAVTEQVYGIETVPKEGESEAE